MIFAKSHVVSEDQDGLLFRTDVTIKVSKPNILPQELQSVLSAAIDDEHTDLEMCEQIAKIMEEEAEKLATKVKLLMEGE